MVKEYSLHCYKFDGLLDLERSAATSVVIRFCVTLMKNVVGFGRFDGSHNYVDLNF